MKARVLAPLLIVMLILTACDQQKAAEVTPDQISVQLKWLHQAQFAGFYVAETQGYYAEENLDVTLIPGGVGIDMVDVVINGDATFGIASADSLIVERANGVPVTAIAVTYRINPFVLVAFAESGIRSPEDFGGKTVSVSENYNNWVQLSAMLSKVGVEADDVHLVPYTYDNTAFLNGEVDVLNSFAAGSLLVLEAELGDREINLIWPGDYGVHFYSDTIFATEDTLVSDPDLVLRFLRATLKGHRFAIENRDEAVEASMTYAEVQDRDVQTRMMVASVPLIHTGEDPIGWMQPTVWQDMHDLLLEQGVIAEPVNLDKVYTLDFLQGIYGKSS